MSTTFRVHRKSGKAVGEPITEPYDCPIDANRMGRDIARVTKTACLTVRDDGAVIAVHHATDADRLAFKVGGTINAKALGAPHRCAS